MKSLENLKLVTMYASLPMYDYPEVRQYTDAFWRGLKDMLVQAGISDVPQVLDRQQDTHALWRSDALFLTQTCGYPLRHGFSENLTAVAVPHYDVPGCDGANYRSAVVARADTSADSLLDFQGQRFAANSSDSQSGYQCMRRMLAELSIREAFFTDVLYTGGHRNSLRALRERQADIACIDAVSLSLVKRYAPQEFDGLTTIQWGPAAPSLPFATTKGASTELIKLLRIVLTSQTTLFENSMEFSQALDALMIRTITPTIDSDYDVVVAMSSEADAQEIKLCH